MKNLILCGTRLNLHVHETFGEGTNLVHIRVTQYPEGAALSSYMFVVRSVHPTLECKCPNEE